MSLGKILAWKFDNAPGIRTRERQDAKGKPDGSGVMEVFDWPSALGPEPTQAQIAQWTGEYNARPPIPSRDEILADLLQSAPDAAKWGILIAHLKGD
jgi:hypothetical protein